MSPYFISVCLHGKAARSLRRLETCVVWSWVPHEGDDNGTARSLCWDSSWAGDEAVSGAVTVIPWKLMLEFRKNTLLHSYKSELGSKSVGLGKAEIWLCRVTWALVRPLLWLKICQIVRVWPDSHEIGANSFDRFCLWAWEMSNTCVRKCLDRVEACRFGCLGLPTWLLGEKPLLSTTSPVCSCVQDDSSSFWAGDDA